MEDCHRIKALFSEGELFPLEQAQAASAALYGEQSTAGILYRVGRAAFSNLLMNIGVEAGYTDAGFKLLPLKKKTLCGLELLAKVFEAVPDQSILVESNMDCYLWKVAFNGDRSRQHILGCTFFNGLLQEYMAWMGSGKVFLVDEIACQADGAEACIFHINKVAID